MGTAGLESRRERVGLNRGREDVNQALFSRGKAIELRLRQTVLPRERAGWCGDGGRRRFFLQKRDDIQAVRGRGLAMSRKSEGNVDWKPKEENAKQGGKSLVLPLLLLCYGGVERSGERPGTPFHCPTPESSFQLTSQNRNPMPFIYHMNKFNSYQCTNIILRVTRPDGRWLEIGQAHQPHPSPAQY